MPNQERLRETKHHGAVRFPFNIYPCTIPGDFLQVPLHWHDSMELVYVKKGSGIVQVGVNAYPAEQGDIYIFAPGTLHALHQRGQAVMEYENIIFELELLGGADDLCAERYLLPLQSGRMALQPRIIPGEAGYPQAAACLQEAEEANKVKTAGYELAIKGALLRFLSILIGQHGTPLPADTTDTRRLKTVLQLIEAEYATPLRIEDAAEACGSLFPAASTPAFRKDSPPAVRGGGVPPHICAFLYTFGTTSADFRLFFVISKNHGKIVNFL